MARWSMTEEEWRSCEDWYAYAQTLQGLVLDGHPGITDRRAQLFDVACARRVAHLLPNELCRRTIELAEIAADAIEGPLAASPLVTYAEIWAALDPYGPPPDYLPRPPLDDVTQAGLELVASIAHPEQVGARVRHMGGWAGTLAARAAGTPQANPESRVQLALLRDIFGNPFHPVTFARAWRTPTAVGLAEGIYADRAFDRLPILADALQDAGCEDADVLGHCRGGGPHARGCWVVDGVLGKG